MDATRFNPSSVCIACWQAGLALRAAQRTHGGGRQARTVENDRVARPRVAQHIQIGLYRLIKLDMWLIDVAHIITLQCAWRSVTGSFGSSNKIPQALLTYSCLHIGAPRVEPQLREAENFTM